MRRLFIAIAAVALGCLSVALFVFAGAPPRTGPGSTPGAAQIPAPAGAATADAESVPGTADRELLSTTPDRAVQVRVMRAVDRTPVPGARVAACDFDELLARIGAGKNLDLAARRAVHAEIATVVLADDAGVARVPAIDGRLLLDATHGRLWGRRVLAVLPKEPVELLVAEDLTLRAQVLSRDERRPVADARVALRRPRSGSQPFASGGTRATAGDGIASFPHVQTTLKDEDGWHLCFGFPLLQGPVYPVARELLREAVQMILAPTGSLEVRIRDEIEGPVPGATVAVRLEAFPTAQRETPLWNDGVWPTPRVDAGGDARVPFVGLGVHLRVTVRSTDPNSLRKPVTVDLEGPVWPGEVARCEVEWASTAIAEAYYPVVTGRFVREDGTPWPAVQLRAWPSIFPRPGDVDDETLTVVDGGEFRLPLRYPCPPGGRRIYRLSTVADGDGEQIECRLDLSRSFPPGETDLGDVVLGHGILVATGRVVSDAGAPLPEAQVQVRQLVAGNRGELWPNVDCSGGRSLGSDGGFALYAIPGVAWPDGRLRLHVRCNGHTAANVGFSLGARDLRIVLPRTGALSGSVALAPDQAPDDIAVVLRSEDRVWTPELEPDGTFAQDGLSVGALSLAAYLRTGSKTEAQQSRVEVEGLLIASGETNRDPRVQNLWIAGTAAKVRLWIVDEASTPIDRAEVGFVDQPWGRSRLSDRSGQVTLRPPKLPVDVEILAFGYRGVRIAGLQADQRVVLKRGLPVRLTTEARPHGKAPAYHLGFTLYHVDGKGRRGRRVYGSAFPYDRGYFDAAGEARLPLPGPGTYEVLPWVYIDGKDNVGRGGNFVVDPIPRITVQEIGGEQTFAIDIPQHLLDAAVQRFAR